MLELDTSLDGLRPFYSGNTPLYGESCFAKFNLHSQSTELLPVMYKNL